MMGTTTTQRGFTIVELLIVIVVIAILAAITIAAFNGVQQRARDTDRRTDIAALVKAMSTWSVQEGKTPMQTGAGLSDGGSGWVYANSYTNNIETVLKNAGVLSGNVRDPQTPTGVGSYMFYQCNTTTKKDTYAFFARLESPSTNDTDFAQWQADGCNNSPINPTYTMNYARIFSVAP